MKTITLTAKDIYKSYLNGFSLGKFWVQANLYVELTPMQLWVIESVDMLDDSIAIVYEFNNTVKVITYDIKNKLNVVVSFEIEKVNISE